LADRDIDDIRRYIERDNPRAANNMLDKVFGALETLANNPKLGERRSDLGENLRAFVVQPYVIFYHPAVDGIHVARVIHGARDFPAMFE
jgi:toxin ParE1/3/4